MGTTTRTPRSRVRDWALATAAYCTFVAVAFGYGWIACTFAAVAAALLIIATNYRGRRLFVTPHPDRYPVGSTWRRWKVTAVEPHGDNFWLVRGERQW